MGWEGADRPDRHSHQVKTKNIMKIKTSLILATLAGSLTLANADERTIGNGNLPDFLVPFDVNNDNAIDEEERQAMKEAREEERERRYSRWDTNEDGTVDELEREEARTALREMIEEKRNRRFFEADTDESGDLDRTEFNSIPAVTRLNDRHPKKVDAIFDRLDADDNDLISLEEFANHLGHRRGGLAVGPGGERPGGGRPGGEGGEGGEG
jgi:Ca2+-binding EF-hand superfamily protein